MGNVDIFPLISPNDMVSNVDIFPLIYPNDIVSNVDIFPLISPNDIVTINKLTLILKIIGPSEVKHIMAFYFKNGSC
jgi:hypothetical protein